MQAIMETLFDVVYLTTVITLGILMIKRSKGDKQYLLFGIMAVVLGAGDSLDVYKRQVLALVVTTFIILPQFKMVSISKGSSPSSLDIVL